MTEAVMCPTALIEQIKVTKDRARKDIGQEEIMELVESIKRHGVLQPIIVTEDFELVAGFRRFTACIIAGLDDIPYRLKGELTDIEFREIELEENLQRKAMTWDEEQDALAEIHRLRLERDPTWTVPKTAAMAGKKKSSVYNALELAEAMEVDPRIRESTTLTSALHKLATAKALDARKAAIAAKKSGDGISVSAEVRHGRAEDLILDIPDGSIDHILTNAPFGIDLSIGGEVPYEDSNEYVTDLVRNLCSELYRVTKPTSWVVIFFDMRKITHNAWQEELYEKINQIITRLPVSDQQPLAQSLERSMGLAWWLQEAGFEYVSKQPFAWVKPNKTAGQLGNPTKGLISSWESAIFAARTDARFLRQGKQNHFAVDIPLRSKRIDAVEMPVEACESIIEMIALGGEVVLDPFAGTAATGIACMNRQVEFIGFELNERKADEANVRLQEHEYA